MGEWGNDHEWTRMDTNGHEWTGLDRIGHEWGRRGEERGRWSWGVGDVAEVIDAGCNGGKRPGSVISARGWFCLRK